MITQSRDPWWQSSYLKLRCLMLAPDVTVFAEMLERERYFEVDKVVADDLNRSAFYSSNAQRGAYQGGFAEYGEFLASLEMTRGDWLVLSRFT